MIKRFLRTDNDPAALIMRLALGLVMFPHGAQKVLGWWGGHGAAATIQGFSKMGLPDFITVLVMLAEFPGSLMLIFGLLTRLAAFGIGCVMLAAVVMVHAKGRGIRIPSPRSRPFHRTPHQGRWRTVCRSRHRGRQARIHRIPGDTILRASSGGNSKGWA